MKRYLVMKDGKRDLVWDDKKEIMYERLPEYGVFTELSINIHMLIKSCPYLKNVRETNNLNLNQI